MFHSFSTTFIFAPHFALKGHKSKTLLTSCIFNLFSSQTPNLQILKVCVLESNIVWVERVEQCVRKVLVDVRNCYAKRVQNRYYTRLYDLCKFMVFESTIYLDARYAAILCAIMLLNRKVVNINPDIYTDTAKQKLGRTWLEFHDEITQGSYM